MTKPRIFISHSAREPDAIAVLDAVYDALARSGRYQVFLDRETLEPGVLWRSTINHWLGLCDAAVVVLSESALERPYVAYELSLLSYRFASRDDSRLMPVYVAPVTVETVRANELLKPTLVAERQGIAGDPATAGAEVLARLGELAIGTDTPVERRARALARILDLVGDTARRNMVQDARTLLLEDVESALGKDAADAMDAELAWLPGDDQATQRLAIQLMRAGVELAASAVDFMRPLVVAAADAATYRRLVDLVASSWVDHRSVEVVPETARAAGPLRTLALNATRAETAQLYVECARTSRPVVEEWYVTQCPDRSGEELLVSHVREALIQKIEPDEEEGTLEDMLDTFDRRKRPVIVALPKSAARQLPLLRDAFPTVTFFFLLGEDATRDSTPAAVWERRLVPGLDRGHEEAIYKHITEFRRFVRYHKKA